LIGPLGFAGKNLSRRGFHAWLAFLGLAVSVAATTFLILLGQGLADRLGVSISSVGTFGINWLFFGFLFLSLVLIIIVGALSNSYLVSSMVAQRSKDIGVIKAAGSLPARLSSYASAEGMLVIISACLLGGVSAFIAFLVWSWPSPDLSGQVGPVANAGSTALIAVPLGTLLLSILVLRHQLNKIVGSNTIGALSAQLSGLDLKTVGRPLRVSRLGSSFNLATRNVSRDREFNRTLVRIILCIFLTTVVITSAFVSADTSKSYVDRALPENTIIVASPQVLAQYTLLGTAFSSSDIIPSFNYTAPAYIMNSTVADAFRGISGVQRVDNRLVTTSSVRGYVKAHLVTNETSGNYNDVYVLEQYLGSTQALLVGLDPNNVIGNWYTSDGFLKPSDPNNTMIAGDSLIGGVVQMPYSLAQIGALGVRYNVKSALVDPLNKGRVLYAPVQSLQASLGINGYNVILVSTDNKPSTVSAVTQLAAVDGLSVGSMNLLRNSNLSFLDGTWSYIFILPILTLALTCGMLLSYLTSNFSRRFNDYLVLRVLGAKARYSLGLLLWEGWGLLAVSMLIAIPFAWLFSIFFTLPESVIPITDLAFSGSVLVGSLSLVALLSAVVYSRRLGRMTVKDLRL
jgi:ABC-type antimicrobial peptide transport system permease subunit